MLKIINLLLLIWALSASIYSYQLKQSLKARPVKMPEEKILTRDISSCSVTPLVQQSILSNEDEPKQRSSIEDYRVNVKISAVEKFVQLNDSQRELLKNKFKAELNKQEAPSLEQIIGKESADFYKQEVIKAYNKNHQEQVDKEVFYLSRILALSAPQETQVRQIVSDIKNSTDYLESQHKPKLEKMLDSVKVQNELLLEKMKEVLNAEQYKAFFEYQNNSSDSDFTMLHTESAE